MCQLLCMCSQRVAQHAYEVGTELKLQCSTRQKVNLKQQKALSKKHQKACCTQCYGGSTGFSVLSKYYELIKINYVLSGFLF